MTTYEPLAPLYSDTPDADWGQQVNDNFTYLFEDRPTLAGFQADLLDVLADDETELADMATTVSADGLYVVTVKIGSTAATGGANRRYVRLKRDGDTIAIRQGAASLNGTFHTALSALVTLAAGDTLTVSVYQNSNVTMSYYGTLTGLLVAPSA